MSSLVREINSKYKIKVRFFNFLSSSFVKIWGLSHPNRWSSVVAEKIVGNFKTVRTKVGGVRITVSNPLMLMRADTFFTKEPETLNWIDSFDEKSVFYDIGANVGLYSIYAAKNSQQVYSFEPFYENYAILNKNLYLNQCENARAYCLAVSDKNGFDVINISDATPGSALHSFQESIGADHKSFDPVFKQGCLGVTLDSLVYEKNFPCPNYLKIDVDGLESKIIHGAEKVLSDEKLKGILIELNDSLQADVNLLKKIKEHGFEVVEEGKKSQNETSLVGNYIFKRKK